MEMANIWTVQKRIRKWTIFSQEIRLIFNIFLLKMLSMAASKKIIISKCLFVVVFNLVTIMTRLMRSFVLYVTLSVIIKIYVEYWDGTQYDVLFSSFLVHMLHTLQNTFFLL